MLSVLESCSIDRGFEPRPCEIKDYATGICCVSAKHASLRRKRAQPGLPGIRIMCSNGATCLSMNCCCSKLALSNTAKPVGIAQTRSRLHLVEHSLLFSMI
jgi:hypothetical protein